MYTKQNYRKHCTVTELTQAELIKLAEVKRAARTNLRFRAFLDNHPRSQLADMAEAEMRSLHSYSWEHAALFADVCRYQQRAWIAVYDEWQVTP